jgi:DNA-directed RNA polymerase specialized sigma24 family protein
MIIEPFGDLQTLANYAIKGIDTKSPAELREEAISGMLVAYYSLSNPDTIRHPKSWAQKVMRREAFKHLYAYKSQDLNIDEIEPCDTTPIDVEPIGEMAKRFARLALPKRGNAMNEKSVASIIFCYSLGYSMRETSELTNHNPRTVWETINRLKENINNE